MKEDREIVPLRTILQNCLNHIENLESNRSICDNYEKEFQDLKQFSETLKARKEFACTEGEKEVNRKKNRYKDILPFNVSRVILSKYAGIPGSDYINANYIKGASGSPAYIASQGPLPNTVNDFWRMVVECEVQVIVMACNAEEAGKHKCENYWVEKEGEEKRFGMVEICLVKASTVCPDFLVRTMRLKYTNDKSITEERTICQFHYSAWPDHGVPPLVRPLLDMVRLVRDTQASETLPVLVHCSAGCGRTGTICAIDFVWGLLRAGKLTEEFSLFNLVKDMRKQRVAMVQTKEQYILVHQAVRELFKEQLRVIESHPYENIDVNGVPLIKDYEEPLYDTIGPSKKDFDEKKDDNEVEKSELEKKETLTNNFNKSDMAPPLPRKKRPNIPFSKQEKEVENLTEKNRCSAIEKEKENMDESASNSLLSKPRIAKLKALFERSPTNRDRNSSKLRSSQTVSRSHSLGAIRKPLFSEVFDHHYAEKYKSSNSSAQPIPDGGKLKVPKLSLSTAAVGTKPVPLIKRSKSLKAISQPQKLTTLTTNSNAIRDTQNQLRIMNKTIAKDNISTKKHETVSKATFKKPLTTQNLQKAQFCNELYKRRRSLESLIGDEPPVITWPTTVMHPSSVVNSDLKTQCNRNSSELISFSSKSNTKGLPAMKDISTESIKQQFQNLSIEAQKKMNTFAAGIGIRERRNSFRQAISRDNDYAARENHAYEYIWLDLKKSKQKLENKTIQVNSYPENFNNKLTVRSQNGDILNPVFSCDQLDGINVRKEELSYNFNQTTNKTSSDSQNKVENATNAGSQHKPSVLQRGKTQVMKSGNETYHSRFSHKPHELASTFLSHTLQDKNTAFSLRTNDDSRRIVESKNLFLQRLNTEIQEGKNLRMSINKDDNLGTNSKLDSMPVRRGDADYAGVSESVAISPGRKFTDKGTVQDSLVETKWKKVNTVRLNSDDHKANEAVWNHGRQFIPTKDKTVKSAVSSSMTNTNFLGIHAFGKTNETHKVYESQNIVRETQASTDIRKGIHRNISSTNRSLDPQTSDNENSSSRRLIEPIIKDSYIEMDKKIHRDWIPPSNKPQKNDLAIKSQSTRQSDYPSKSYDSHNPMSSQSNTHPKKSMSNPNTRKPQFVEVQKKNFLSGANSLSSHSSGDLSHSDQFSQTSESPKIMESHEVESNIKPEVIRLRSNQLRTLDKKAWIDDTNKHEHESESSSSSSVRELASMLPIKPSEESYNYGIVASVKLRPSKPSHSRDDFVLGEPIAPPRVKRHASVKITRQGGNESNVIHLSTWASPDKKMMEANNWNDALGVDLDAVAASIQRQKAESSSSNEAFQSGSKNYSTSGSAQYSFKKQQHYL